MDTGFDPRRQEVGVKFRYFGVLALLALPAYAPAASSEIQELQRDVAFLQEQVKVLQVSQNLKFAALSASVQAGYRQRQGRGKKRRGDSKQCRPEPQGAADESGG